MGPRITDEEAKQIDFIAQKNPANYKQMFRKNRPSLYEMKKLYDEAISSDPKINLDSKCNYSSEKIKELKYKANCCAVDKLKNM